MKGNLKEVLSEFFSVHERMIFGKMYFRLFNPTEESIVDNFTVEDWNLIFPDLKEDDLKDLNECINVVILVWCDSFTDKSHGLLYLQESYPTPGTVTFHGGVWDHQPVFFHNIFRSLLGMFRFIFKFCPTIKTTCRLDNKRADRFLRSFGLTETHHDEEKSYKTLNKELLEGSIIAKCPKYSFL